MQTGGKRAAAYPLATSGGGSLLPKAPAPTATHRVLGGLVCVVRPLLGLGGASVALQLVSSGETPGRKGAQELLLNGLAQAAGCGEGHGCGLGMGEGSWWGRKTEFPGWVHVSKVRGPHLLVS